LKNQSLFWLVLLQTAAVAAVVCSASCSQAEAIIGKLVESQARAEDLEFFEAKVRPLLVRHCAECHSRAAGEPEGGLSFDTRSDFFAAEGVAVAGKPDESLLVKVIRYDSDLQMPPDGDRMRSTTLQPLFYITAAAGRPCRETAGKLPVIKV